MERLPEQIEVGMKVFDSELREIGRVEDLKYPENAIEPGVQPATAGIADVRDATLAGAVAEAFGREDVPEPLTERIVHIEAGRIVESAGIAEPEATTDV